MNEDANPIGTATAARRSTANSPTILAVAGVMILLLWPGKIQPLPQALQARVSSVTAQWAFTPCETAMPFLGYDAKGRNGRYSIRMPDGTVRYTTIAEGILGIGDVFWPVTLAALLGAVAAAGTWDFGWVRRSILVIPAGVVAPILLTVLHGIFVAVAVLYWIRREGQGRFAFRLASQTAASVTLALMGLSWWVLRSRVAKPVDKYWYRAKVQVAPAPTGRTLAQQDAACTDFLRQVTPVVLKYLPSAGDVDRLNRQADEAK